MKLLFITPPMGNWAPWGERHLAVNPLHAQVAGFIISGIAEKPNKSGKSCRAVDTHCMRSSTFSLRRVRSAPRRRAALTKTKSGCGIAAGDSR